jgi:acyl-CoA hydrolase
MLHSTTADESVSHIVAQLHPGAAVTTFSHYFQSLLSRTSWIAWSQSTEHGAAELRGSSIRERTRRLIGVAHPKFRDELERQAREIEYL